MGSASVADTGRFNTSKSPSDPQRKTVGKKIAQIRQGGSDSRGPLAKFARMRLPSLHLSK